MEKENWRRSWLLALSLILMQQETSTAVNILAFFPLASRSHNNIFSAVTMALSQKGHHFTVVTSQPVDSPPPNYHQIDVTELMSQHFNIFNTTRKIGMSEMIGKMTEMIEDSCSKLLQVEEVKALVKPKDGMKFDLILMSSFLCECLYPFSPLYGAPIVLISPHGAMPSTYSASGNVVLPSYHANPILGYSDRMTFKERVINTLVYVGYSAFNKHYVQRKMESYMRIAFGEDTPSISELEEHVSLSLLNSHFSLTPAQPTVPSLIEAGGLHIKAPKELPKHLKTFLDGAGKDGAIYFSLGSILKSSRLPDETRDELIAAFSRVKQRVLWKWEGESPLPGQSENVRLEKWLPQQDVLAHPNVKIFITHGGLLSFQEAASRGVPVIGIPHYGDQEMNMRRVLDHGVGVEIDARNITASNVLGAIDEILGNPVYSTNMKRLQSIVMDQKDHPLDRAVYWIEYVIRHKGAKHLKPAAFYLQWHQVYMLDVLLVLVVVPSLVALATALVCLRVIKRICRSRGKSTTPKKKEQ